MGKKRKQPLPEGAEQPVKASSLDIDSIFDSKKSLPVASTSKAISASTESTKSSKKKRKKNKTDIAPKPATDQVEEIMDPSVGMWQPDTPNTRPLDGAPDAGEAEDVYRDSRGTKSELSFALVFTWNTLTAFG